MLAFALYPFYGFSSNGVDIVATEIRLQYKKNLSYASQLFHSVCILMIIQNNLTRNLEYSNEEYKIKLWVRTSIRGVSGAVLWEKYIRKLFDWMFIYSRETNHHVIDEKWWIIKTKIERFEML